MEVRERLEEALDCVCLDVLVRRHRERGLPPPAADSAADRAEYEAHVRALLRRLAAEVPAGDEARSDVPRDDAALLQAQVHLAQRLPDYWQRFEAVSERYRAERGSTDGEPSGGERRRLLAWLFGPR